MNPNRVAECVCDEDESESIEPDYKAKYEEARALLERVSDHFVFEAYSPPVADDIETFLGR